MVRQAHHDVLRYTLSVRITILFIVVGFFAVTFAVYGHSLHDAFVTWDDTYLIYANPDVKGLTWHNIKNVFSTYDPELYIPLTFVTWQIDYTIGGMHPFLFHFDNLILHTLNALLVAWLLLLLFKNRTAALLGGLLFAVHPLHAEATLWASARKDVLSTFFFLGSLVAYLHYVREGRRKPYYISLIAFALGLLSKVMVITLPVVLLLIDFLQRRKVDRTMVLEKIPFFLLSLLFGIVALFGKRDVVSTTTLLQKILMAGKSTVFYLEKFLVPINLTVIYPYDKPIVASSPDFLIPWAIVIFLIILVLWSLRFGRTVFFGAAFFFVTLLPTFTNFAKGGDFYFASDRYAYIPSIGLLIVLCGLIFCGQEWPRWLKSQEWPRWVKNKWHLLFGAIIIIFSLLAYRQSLIWEDSVALFSHTLKLYPRSVAAHINLGVMYRKMNRLEDSRRELQSALAIKPHARAYTAIAAIDLLQGRTDDAIAACKKAQTLDLRDPEPLYGLALSLAQAGKKDEAISMYRQTLMLEPHHLGAMNNLAALYLEIGKRAEAEKYYRLAIATDTTFIDAHYNLGIMLEQDGKPLEAAMQFEETTKWEGDTIPVLQKLAEIYAKANWKDETIRTLKRMLVIDPQNEFAIQLLEGLRRNGF